MFAIAATCLQVHTLPTPKPVYRPALPSKPLKPKPQAPHAWLRRYDAYMTASLFAQLARLAEAEAAAKLQALTDASRPEPAPAAAAGVSVPVCTCVWTCLMLCSSRCTKISHALYLRECVLEHGNAWQAE